MREYVPNPRRCFQCQKFGHTSKRSTRLEACSYCSSEGHKKEKCEASIPICANCNNVPAHQSASRECPTYNQEYNFQRIMTTKKKTYKDAKIMSQILSIPNTTYSNVTANNKVIINKIPNIKNKIIENQQPEERTTESTSKSQTSTSETLSTTNITEIETPRSKSMDTINMTSLPPPTNSFENLRSSGILSTLLAAKTGETTIVGNTSIHPTTEKPENADVNMTTETDSEDEDPRAKLKQ